MNSNQKYLVLSGFKKSGKDTFADMVLKNLKGDALKYDIAGKLKKVTCELLGVPLANAYDETLKEELLATPFDLGVEEVKYLLNAFSVNLSDDKIKVLARNDIKTLRFALQYFGTEVLRETGPDIHCTEVSKTIKKDSPRLAIISDCRFFNELHFFNSPTFFVHRKDKFPENTPDLHPSEKTMFEIMGHLPWIDNNSTLSDLEKKARFISNICL